MTLALPRSTENMASNYWKSRGRLARITYSPRCVSGVFASEAGVCLMDNFDRFLYYCLLKIRNEVFTFSDSLHDWCNWVNFSYYLISIDKAVIVFLKPTSYCYGGKLLGSTRSRKVMLYFSYCYLSFGPANSHSSACPNSLYSSYWGSWIAKLPCWHPLMP